MDDLTRFAASKVEIITLSGRGRREYLSNQNLWLTSYNFTGEMKTYLALGASLTKYLQILNDLTSREKHNEKDYDKKYGDH